MPDAPANAFRLGGEMDMIRIGLAGWGDQEALYPEGLRPADKLRVYSSFFSVVEVDSSFYAILPERNVEKWVTDTPRDFAFVVKAYQGMTGHTRGKSAVTDPAEMFKAFRTSLAAMRRVGKLKAVLFQYPPWFDCTKEHIAVLRKARERMTDWPVALEFRHQSWFAPDVRQKTLDFMRAEGWAHSICDEPQAGEGSVPTVLEPTDPALTIVRFHGRNVEGWLDKGNPNWRDVRYLYDYSPEELAEWVGRLRELSGHTREICVLFNNNSGGHAAGNALTLMQQLGQPTQPLPPRQLEWF